MSKVRIAKLKPAILCVAAVLISTAWVLVFAGIASAGPVP